jgi:Fe-S-cluster containining protein
MRKKWWKEGIRFGCQGCGGCCISHGEFGYVYVNRNERKKMAQHLDLTLVQFTKKFCLSEDGHYWLISDQQNASCIFLQDGKCQVYEVRPFQCRSWPFWGEVLFSEKSWQRNVKKNCPGIGQGKHFDSQEIDQILSAHAQWERGLTY